MFHGLLKYAPLLLLLSWAAAVDWRTRRIPNWLTLLLIVGGIAQSFCAGRLLTPGQSLLGILAGASLPLVLFAIGAVGGGDVKLMAGIGAWIGPLPALAVILLEKVIGLIIVLSQAAWHGRTRVLLRNSAVVTLNILYVREVGLQHATQTGKACRSVDRPLPFAIPALVAVLVVVIRLGSNQ
jgi:prepilin peptidase CpaA